MHVRDFAQQREQRSLASLTADEGGYVRFVCLHCPRTGKIPLATLRERFRPDAGLVDILNAMLPEDCAKSVPDPSGIRACGFCYRDLGGAQGASNDARP
jgi:hypothetical protein